MRCFDPDEASRGRRAARARSKLRGAPVAEGETWSAADGGATENALGTKGTSRGRLASRVSKPALLSEEALREAALRYLDRQDASVSQLRRVLLRRVARYSDASADGSVRPIIEQVLVRFQDSRLLDDARYARALAQSLRGRGQSEAKIRTKLRSRGISEPETDAALEALSGQELGEEQAALVYAKRRRLAERLDLSDPKQRQKALASLARQGFSFEVARRVLELSG